MLSGDLPPSEGDTNRTAGRAGWLGDCVSDATREWLEEDERWFLRQSLSTPCLDVLAECSGTTIRDLQGRRFLDFHGNSVHQVGYANPRVLEAIRSQLEVLPFCPRRYTNVPAIRLAARLAELAPGRLRKCLFAPGGAEAMGMALKLARMVTGRFKTVSMWDSFHGASLDTISVGGEALFRKGVGPLLPGAEHVPPPHPAGCLFGCGGRCTLQCAAYLEYVLEREGDVAAVVAEPIRSTMAVPPPDGYWLRVRQACDRHGALLIFDEIPIGLGRTGHMFASETVGITPDILVLGKGLGGGVIPMAAIVAREDLDVAPAAALGHYTHEKSPLGAAAALATLDEIEQRGLLENARQLGALALERLRALAARHSMLQAPRGIGLLLALDVERDGARAPDLADAILYAALRRGLSFKTSGGNVIVLTPPLTLRHEEMGRAVELLEAAVAEVEAAP